MPHLPTRFAAVILAFAPLFVHRSWRHARVLLIGAILTPGRRTVASALRITGRSRERRFVNFHRVLSRAAWCPRAGGRVLLGLLVGALRAGRARGAGPRRYDRTALGAAHRRPRHLPRSRAIVRRPLRQDERPALDEPDGARARCHLGWAGLGVAVPDRARPLRTELPRAGAPAQYPCSTPGGNSRSRRAAGCPAVACQATSRFTRYGDTHIYEFLSSAGRDGWTRPPRHQALDCFSSVLEVPQPVAPPPDVQHMRSVEQAIQDRRRQHLVPGESSASPSRSCWS